MEWIFADLINNPKVPKLIRYSIVTAVCAFVIFLGVSCAVNSPMLWGKIFGGLFAIGSLIIGICLYIKIFRSSK